MASKYELTISTNYVADWTFVEAIRELFQNAIDNQTKNPENTMYFNYDNEKNVLSIGNKTSCLTLDTLLLGSSTKRDDKDTIGKHGEGYKIAFMVLLREGKTVTVYNYGAREIWRTKLVKSKRFENQLVPVIFVEKAAFWEKVPSHDLMIEVEGITAEEYAKVVESNLHLQTIAEEDMLVNKDGSRILLNPAHRGKIFVRGLYISTNVSLHKGYDFAPDVIKLDRDRKLVDSFDLSWQASQLWNKVLGQGKARELYLDLAKADAMDVKFVTDVVWSTPDAEVKTMAYTSFVEEHGVDSVPVSSNEELTRAMEQGKRPVMLPKTMTNLIKGADEYAETGIKILTPKEELQAWFKSVNSKLTRKQKEAFNNIYKKL